MRWWDCGVIYQIYPRSFSDSNGDGVGDLEGIRRRLDYLGWLGVDAVWFNPTMPSPNADWGYDVSDYRDVHPDLGTLAELDVLIKEAHRRDIRVLLDLVPNHTSSQHPWFIEARRDPRSRYRDWYVWADQSPGGGPPNNWLSSMGGPAWTFDEVAGQYYLHNFLPEQPDLNWSSEAVRNEFDEILKFWFDRGVAGFRIDVAHALVSDPDLRDNPPPAPEDHPEVLRIGQQQVFNMNRPEVHDILRRWRAICDSYDDRGVLVGETYVFDLQRLASYYGAAEDELHLCLNFPFLFAELFSDEQRWVVSRTIELLRGHGVPVWAGSNHDAGRFPSRWCDGSEDLVRCALFLLLGLPGAAVLYYGDEIGMGNVDLDRDQLRDPIGVKGWPARAGRDPGRTPMQWEPGPGAGFTSAERPWLPLGDAAACNVADQAKDAGSVLNLCRDLVRLRKSNQSLRSSSFSAVGDHAWAWRRGEDLAVVINATPDHLTSRLSGRVLISSHRDLDRADLDPLELGPFQAVILDLSRT